LDILAFGTKLTNLNTNLKYLLKENTNPNNQILQNITSQTFAIAEPRALISSIAQLAMPPTGRPPLNQYLGTSSLHCWRSSSPLYKQTNKHKNPENNKISLTVWNSVMSKPEVESNDSRQKWRATTVGRSGEHRQRRQKWRGRKATATEAFFFPFKCRKLCYYQLVLSHFLTLRPQIFILWNLDMYFKHF
jgi:hypothetical protein